MPTGNKYKYKYKYSVDSPYSEVIAYFYHWDPTLGLL